MFTGIIQEKGRVERVDVAGHRRYITISCKTLQKDLFDGASVACDGICLTVISFNEKELKVEFMEETAKKTTVGNWRKGDEINLERALRMDSFLDGHLVQGHVDSVAEVLRVTKEKNSILITIGYEVKDRDLLVPKGSIAVNGVSLTIAELDHRSFMVSLVGFTLENTNLANLKVRDKVNLEYDVIGKYVARMIGKNKPGLTEDYLREKGF
ncbi:MAG: riboflavin synthase [Candidatus Cloacimonadia bacterium]|jgi:riboflavin synthase